MEKENQRNGQTQNEEGWNFRERKVQLVTLPELQRTHKENDCVGNPLKGIYHCDLIREIGEIVEGMGLRMQVEEIFAAQNREKNQPGVVLLPKVEEVYGPNAVEAHILRRVFANVRILDLDDEEFTTNLAVAFHQKVRQPGPHLPQPDHPRGGQDSVQLRRRQDGPRRHLRAGAPVVR